MLNRYVKQIVGVLLLISSWVLMIWMLFYGGSEYLLKVILPKLTNSDGDIFAVVVFPLFIAPAPLGYAHIWFSEKMKAAFAWSASFAADNIILVFIPPLTAIFMAPLAIMLSVYAAGGIYCGLFFMVYDLISLIRRRPIFG